MDQSEHVTPVIAITDCKVIKKLITKMSFLYLTYVNQRQKKVYLVMGNAFWFLILK